MLLHYVKAIEKVAWFSQLCKQLQRGLLFHADTRARLRPGMQVHNVQRKRSIAATHLDLILNLDCPTRWRQFFKTLLCRE